MKYRDVVPLVLVAALAVVSAFDLTVHGIFEPASSFVAHLDAGAGSTLLLVRGGLALAAMLALVISALPAQPVIQRLSRLFAGACVLFVFWYSAVGVQRFSDRYDEAAFMGLAHRHHRGEALTSADFREAVGEPIVIESGTREGKTYFVWLYSYMPSCGFGWNKRVVLLDDRGRVTSINTTDEP